MNLAKVIVYVKQTQKINLYKCNPENGNNIATETSMFKKIYKDKDRSKRKAPN